MPYETGRHRVLTHNQTPKPETATNEADVHTSKDVNVASTSQQAEARREPRVATLDEDSHDIHDSQVKCVIIEE